MTERRPVPLRRLAVALVVTAVLAGVVPLALFGVLDGSLHHDPFSPAALAAEHTPARSSTGPAPAADEPTTAADEPTTAASPSTSAPGAPGTSAPPTSGPAPAAPAAGDVGRAEAQAIAALVAKSGTARAKVIEAVNGVTACSLDPADGEDAMTTAGASRQQVLDDIGRLPAGLPEAATVVPVLQQAMQESLAANQAFEAWMHFVDDQGCDGHAPTNSDFAAANAASGRATAAKQAFVAAWNPVAARFGLPAVTERDL